jgi:hypothetical protein
MSDLPPIDEEYLLTVLVELLNTPSPTGFAGEAIEVVEREKVPWLPPGMEPRLMLLEG